MMPFVDCAAEWWYERTHDQSLTSIQGRSDLRR